MIDHTHNRSDQRDEEEGEPDDTDEEKDNEPAHSIFHYLLLFLPFWLRISLEGEHNYTTIFRSDVCLQYRCIYSLFLDQAYVYQTIVKHYRHIK